MSKNRHEDAIGNTRWSIRQFGSRLAMVVAGIVLGQVVLYGPSLVGSKILLPLDCLAQPGVYLPRTAETAKIVPHNFVLSDLVLQDEPNRRFAASEIRAGRWPLWTPYPYAGSPFAGYPKYSPIKVLTCWVESPVVVAWCELLLALFAGLGAYAFCRGVLQVGFWPSVIAGWCWPLTGFFVFWLAYYNLLAAVGCLPWILLAVDKAVRGASRWAGVGLAVVTWMALTSGKLDIAGQVLLVSGLYAVWCFIDEYGKQCMTRRVVPAMAVLISGWVLGFLLASPDLLPMLEYSRTGSRMARRSQGEQERPPVGLDALPQVVLPDMYGSTQDGSFPLFPKGQGNQLESSAVTYTGLLATLLAAPLAWCSRRHRSINFFWAAIGFFALSWCLDVPGVVDLLSAPGLNMMSHNRFVFATSFAILALAAVGLDVLWQGDVRRRWWFWPWAALLAILLVWCGVRAIVLPEEIAIQLENAIRRGQHPMGIADLAGVHRVQATFSRGYAAAFLLCALGIAGWLLLWFRGNRRPWLRILLAGFLVADLLWFAYGRCAQCDPGLYYPPIPALAEVADAPPGRIVGYGCLPAILAQTYGLRDIRGYDGVDSARLMDLMTIAADPNTPAIPYALTQWLAPKISATPSGIVKLSPVFDMLNVRYIVFRGSPPKDMRPTFSSPDYWVLTNRNALPRVFVPSRVETIADDRERLSELASPNFDPRQIAYVEQPTELPDECRGTAEIVDEIPTRITISLDMRTPGLVVLSDLWDAGWRAYYDGDAVPILRTNHAVRGVAAPAGKGTLEFRYEPASLALGLWLCGLALLALIGWAVAIAWNSRGGRKSAP